MRSAKQAAQVAATGDVALQVNTPALAAHTVLLLSNSASNHVFAVRPADATLMLLLLQGQRPRHSRAVAI